MHNQDWDDLRYVLAVAETGSVSAAARLLGVNHATVLRHVAAFEEGNGLTLFEKSARGYAVLPEKARFFDAAREVAAAHAALGRLMRGLHAPPRGVIRVTSTDSLCARFLPRVLARIAAEGSALQFELLSSNLPVDLGRSHADLTVRPALRLADELSGLPAARMRFGLYARRGGDPVPGMLGLTGPLSRSTVALWLAETPGLPPLTGSADSFLTLAAMAAEGLGQAVLPCFLGDADPQLQALSPPGPLPEVPLWVALHADLQGVPRLAAARAVLAGAIGAEAALLEGRGEAVS